MNMPATEITTVSSTNLIMHGDSFDRVMRLADLMASGVATVPKHLQKNPADCAAVIMQAMLWNMNPFAVAQKTHLVNQVLGYEAQLVNAAINSLAPTKDRLHFEWTGDWSKIVGKFRELESKTQKDSHGNPSKYRVPGWNIADETGLAVRVWATLKGEDEPRELQIFMTQARVRNSPLWADDPKQQLAYLAIKRWSRLYCPDVIMGVYTPDEFEVMPSEIDITPRQDAEPLEPQIQAYPEAAFNKNFDKWKVAVEQGTSTHEAWINTLEMKYPLTDGQLARINEIKAPIQGEVVTDANS